MLFLSHSQAVNFLVMFYIVSLDFYLKQKDVMTTDCSANLNMNSNTKLCVNYLRIENNNNASCKIKNALRFC